jgi:S1-C subfamily serine protease
MRQHIEHLLAALGALGFALFVSYFNTGTAIPRAPLNQTGTLTPIATDTFAFATSSPPTFTLSTSTFEALLPTRHASATPPAAAPTPVKKPAAPAPKPVPARPTPPPALPPATSTPATSTPTAVETGELNVLSKSIVNIICIAHDGTLRSISGSGVIIDSRGIILTVSHVAQSTLLEEYRGTDKVSCTVRTGSPARNTYTARPIFVSESWLRTNSTTLISSKPTGTGENDYALLAITGSANGSPLPGAYPAVPLATGSARIGDPVFIGSYGAQDLTSAQVRTSLYPTLVTSTIVDRFTFTSTTVDVLAIGGSAASKEGSSGGAIVNAAGELIGLITTSKTTGDLSSREMRAITPSYIERSYEAATGKDFNTYFGNTSLVTLVNVYAPTVQTLGQFLAHAIGLE